MFKNEPNLLTHKQYQELLHISKSKMLDLIHQDLIPARIIAGSFRIEKTGITHKKIINFQDFSPPHPLILLPR